MDVQVLSKYLLEHPKLGNSIGCGYFSKIKAYAEKVGLLLMYEEAL